MKKLGLTEFLKYNYISNVKISKSGNKIAYCIANADIKQNSYKSSIYIYYKKEDAHIKLSDLGKLSDFIWYDEDSIVCKATFSKEEKKRAQQGIGFTNFYKMDVPKSAAELKVQKKAQPEKLFELPMSVGKFVFLSDEKMIFTANYNKNKLDLSSYLNLGEKEAKQLLAEAKKQIDEAKPYEELDEIAFWLNNAGFTNKDRNRLYLYDRAKNKIEALTDELTSVESFELSPSKREILYVSTRFEDVSPVYNELHRYDLDKKSDECLISKENISFFSADYVGDKILCIASNMNELGINTDADFFELVKKGDKYDLKLLSEGYEYGVGMSVGTDCRYGIYNTKKVCGDKLYFVNTQGFDGKLLYMEQGGKMIEVSKKIGSVDSFDVFEDEVYFVGFRDNKLPELYSIIDGKEKRLSKHNLKFTRQNRIEDITHFTYMSGGVEIDGFAILPPDLDKNKKYPMIVHVHGGPKTVFSTVYHHEMQYFANEGYVVAFCNPRGSDGKGNEFSDIRGKYGTIDYDDIMKLVDVMLEKYDFIDEKRMGIMGGSYGGFMTNWAITQTDRFKAAVSQRSISNWVSKFGMTDIGYYFVPDQQGATPWSDVDKLWRHSPLKYAQNAKTPTLFIHSEEDYRCDLGQGIQMFTALKYFGVESKLVMFRGENHELSRSGKPKARIKRLQEMSDWFEKHLK